VQIVEQSARFTIGFELRGSEHLTTSDAVRLARDSIKTGTMGPDKGVQAVRGYVSAFLDTYLQGKAADPLLVGPSPDKKMGPGIDFSNRPLL
jgi:hypothetical protein